MANEVVKSIQTLMDHPNVKAQFEKALEKHADVFAAGVIEVVSSDVNLQKCDPQSILKSALALATLRLPINKSLGFAYVVPYKGIAQPQIGYKGLVQLAQRTGQYKHINAGCVYEGELVSVNKMTGEVDLSGTKVSDKIIGYFAYFSTNYGFSKCVYWSTDEVSSHAKRFSQAYNYAIKNGKKDSPWISDFDSMAQKTLLKHLISHYGPMTIEIGSVISNFDKFEDSNEAEEMTASEDFDFEITAEKTEEKNQKSFNEITKDGYDIDDKDEPDF